MDWNQAHGLPIRGMTASHSFSYAEGREMRGDRRADVRAAG